MAKKIRVWDGTQWQDVAPSLPYTAIHSAQASMPATGVDGQVWLDTDGTLAGQDFVPLSGGTMTGNLNVPSINSGGHNSRNYILNGGMEIWQRGTSISRNFGYTADQWTVDHVNTSYTANVTLIHSRVFDNNKWYMNLAGNPAEVGVNVGYIALEQVLETPYFLSGKTVTLSFEAKRMGTLSGDCALNCVAQSSRSGSIRDVTTIGTIIASNSSIPTSSYQRYSITFTCPTIPENGILRLGLFFRGTSIGPNSGDAIRLGSFKLEVGSSATEFTRQNFTYKEELEACQRYYEQSYDPGTAPGTVTNNGLWMGPLATVSGSGNFPKIYYKVTKRVPATITVYSNSGTQGSWITFNSGGGQTARTYTGSISDTSGFTGYLNSATELYAQGHWTATAEY